MRKLPENTKPFDYLTENKQLVDIYRAIATTAIARRQLVRLIPSGARLLACKATKKPLIVGIALHAASVGAWVNVQTYGPLVIE